jgi:hypothetical protein
MKLLNTMLLAYQTSAATMQLNSQMTYGTTSLTEIDDKFI